MITAKGVIGQGFDAYLKWNWAILNYSCTQGTDGGQRNHFQILINALDIINVKANYLT